MISPHSPIVGIAAVAAHIDDIQIFEVIESKTGGPLGVGVSLPVILTASCCHQAK